MFFLSYTYLILLAIINFVLSFLLVDDSTFLIFILSIILVVPAFFISFAGSYIDEVVKNPSSFNNNGNGSYFSILGLLAALYSTINSNFLFLLLEKVNFNYSVSLSNIKNFANPESKLQLLNWLLSIIEFTTIYLLPLLFSVFIVVTICLIITNTLIKLDTHNNRFTVVSYYSSYSIPVTIIGLLIVEYYFGIGIITHFNQLLLFR